MALSKPWLNPSREWGVEGGERVRAPSLFVLKNRGWVFLAEGGEPRGSTRQPQAQLARLASAGLTARSLKGPAGICCCCMEFHALSTANEPIGIPLELRWREMPNSHDQWGECR
jgi:hypothetical protein